MIAPCQSVNLGKIRGFFYFPKKIFQNPLTHYAHSVKIIASEGNPEERTGVTETG